MTDHAATVPDRPAFAGTGLHTSDAAVRRLRARYAANRRLQAMGIGAISLALGLLGILLITMVSAGWTAFFQTYVTVEVDLAPEALGLEPGTTEPEAIRRGDFREVLIDSVAARLTGVDDATARRALRDMLAAAAPITLRNMVMDNPALLGQTIEFRALASDRVDQVYKGLIDRELVEDRRTISDQQLRFYDQMVEQDIIAAPFNWRFFSTADSRTPESAGIWGALVGSFYALSVCFLISFPMAIAAAIYLEEFAPKNRWTDLIEVNINNLAAVPSIVFGLLGLAVFIQFFGLPRSAPLVGGMVLALMTLPTIVIAARAALKAVPPSIREGALGMGASKHQTILHHVLPLAMPGILTGTIIGLAQALGETAPLLMIGMNAFITQAPDSITSPATALPTQIYIWADHPERGFVAKTSAGIMVLLGFLIVMNGMAIWLRKKFERRW